MVWVCALASLDYGQETKLELSSFHVNFKNWLNFRYSKLNFVVYKNRNIRSKQEKRERKKSTSPKNEAFDSFIGSLSYDDGASDWPMYGQTYRWSKWHASSSNASQERTAKEFDQKHLGFWTNDSGHVHAKYKQTIGKLVDRMKIENKIEIFSSWAEDNSIHFIWTIPQIQQASLYCFK